MITVEEIKKYIEETISSFKNDPPDTDFQCGYLAAYMSIYEDMFMTREERVLNRTTPKGKVQ